MELLIRFEHERHLHAGPQGTLTALRQNYWILSGRSTVRKVLRKCVICFHAKPRTIYPKMGNLPKDRVKYARPFSVSGVDYAGPIMIKEGRGRGKRSVKAYIVLFVCFATKAVHLELTTDLTTESFLNVLKRFVSRRGHVSQLYSDNATNFVGANRELKTFFQSENFKNAKTEINNRHIKWDFIPARSPHMGGLWEINIRSVKTHLRRMTSRATLTYEELNTLLCMIEACLNSRPLTPLSNDPNDLAPLTPGHFLIGESLTAVADQDLTDIKLNRLSRWQHVEQIRQSFWKRWSREYLTQLQARSKWKEETSRMKIDSLVLLKEENIPPTQWVLGRVVQIHPGDDGVVRVASVKTSKGVVKRAVTKLCALPLDNEDSS